MDMVRHIKNQSDYSSLQRMILNKKINLKMKKVLFLLFVVVTTVVGVSCNDHEEFLMDSVEIPENVETKSISKVSTVQFISVDEGIKKRYKQGYKNAVKGSAPLISKAFYAAYNAVMDVPWRATSGDLKELSEQYHWHSHYLPYKNQEEHRDNFQLNIYNHVYRYHKPVVVLAKTKQSRYDGLTVWAVHWDYGVRVTRISDTPSDKFENNTIIELSWADFFDKAFAGSDNGVANVSFIGEEEKK